MRYMRIASRIPHHWDGMDQAPFRLPTPDDPLWLVIARRYLGVHETPGPLATPEILAFHAATTLKAKSDETHWCASFVTHCLESAGVRSTKSAAAHSYLTWGDELKKPRMGCIVVYASPPHVGFWVGFDATGKKTQCIGGNQQNEVNCSLYPKWRVMSYRYPHGMPFNKREVNEP